MPLSCQMQLVLLSVVSVLVESVSSKWGLELELPSQSSATCAGGGRLHKAYQDEDRQKHGTGCKQSSQPAQGHCDFRKDPGMRRKVVEMDGAPLRFAFRWKYAFRELQAGQGAGFSLRSLFSALSLIYRSASDSEGMWSVQCKWVYSSLYRISPCCGSTEKHHK